MLNEFSNIAQIVMVRRMRDPGICDFHLAAIRIIRMIEIGNDRIQMHEGRMHGYDETTYGGAKKH
jgi:hypothetical protein